MTDPMTIPALCRKWLEDRPEYAASRNLPPDQIVPLIADQVTMGMLNAYIAKAVRREIGSIAHDMGLVAIRAASGETIFVAVAGMTLPMFLDDYLVPQLGRIEADVTSTRAKCGEWVEAHPEAGYSVDQLWQMADDARAA